MNCSNGPDGPNFPEYEIQVDAGDFHHLIQDLDWTTEEQDPGDSPPFGQ